ncbi:hypothetical protein LDENG_00164650 [Lucifuga dentata]|nr:hypothetical protein LDENG_00164650 [Lucifuga dentata]
MREKFWPEQFHGRSEDFKSSQTQRSLQQLLPESRTRRPGRPDREPLTTSLFRNILSSFFNAEMTDCLLH